MKKTFLTVCAIGFSFLASSQLSTEISTTEFQKILQDPKVSVKWNSVQKFNSKSEGRTEDENAVYNSYLQALLESDLNNNQELKPLFNLEIVATENKIKSLKNL